MTGALHEETNYGVKKYLKDKRIIRYLRKPLTSTKSTKADQIKELDKVIESIVDPRIQSVVSAQWNAVGKEPKDFKENPPVIRVDKSRVIPIKSVRVKVVVNAEHFGKPMIDFYGKPMLDRYGDVVYKRYAKTGSNHHIEVFAILDDFGNEVEWEARVVSLLEAYRRVRSKEPIVQRDFGKKTRFKFSLSNGEAFTMNDGFIYVVRSISEAQDGSIEIKSKWHTDARLKKEIEATKGLRFRAGTFQKKGIAKIYVDVLGNIHPAND